MNPPRSPAPDPTAAVRSGEALDIRALGAWLTGHVPGLEGPLRVSQFPAGHSNLTYLLEAGPTTVVLRRPPFGNTVRTAHDMGREHRMLTALAPHFPLAPGPIASCDDPSVLGAPFYLMEYRRGTVLRGPGPHEGLDAATADRLCAAFVDTLVALHTLDYRAIGLADVARPEGYVARQVAGWTRRLAGAATGPLPELDRVGAWLATHAPPDAGASVIHNDFKFDNLLLDPADLTRPIAVLDWEMATVGDPLMDLGTSLGYWIEDEDLDALPDLRSAAFGPTPLPGMWRREQIADAYRARTGGAPRDLTFYYTFGLFKIAGIVQQIFARYHRGDTRDPRFARLDALVRLLGRRAVQAIDRNAL